MESSFAASVGYLDWKSMSNEMSLFKAGVILR
jgi:hypothetical protein